MRGFRVLAVAARPNFICSFRLIHRSFGSDMVIGRLGIEFRAGRGSLDRVSSFGRGGSAGLYLQFLARRSFGSDMVTGRLGIEFRAKKGKKVHVLASVVALVGRRRWLVSFSGV